MQLFDGAKWVEDPAKVEAALIDQVKAEGERRKMLIYTPNRGKMKEYQAKSAEIDGWYSLAGSLSATVGTMLNAALSLPTAQRKRRFRYAMRWVAKRGGTTTIADAIAHFEKGQDSSEDRVADVATVEDDACDAIRAAPTAAAKRAVYAAINWAWTPAT